MLLYIFIYTSQLASGSRCRITNDFSRRCERFEQDPSALYYSHAETAEDCRNECEENNECDMAHWHPGYQIWPDDSRPTCWKWRIGSEACEGNLSQIEFNPGAEMIRCDPSECHSDLPCPNDRYAFCDYQNKRKGLCQSCEGIDDVADCKAQNFTDNGGFVACMTTCIKLGPDNDSRSPDNRLRKLTAKFKEVTNEMIGEHDIRKRFMGRQINKFEILARTMMTWRSKYQNICDYPTDWKDFLDEKFAFDSADRYDRENPCKAYNQFTSGLKKWAQTFNLLCSAVKDENPSKKIEKVELRADRILKKVLPKIPQCQNYRIDFN